jgi:DNA-binding response OmpR family regulator
MSSKKTILVIEDEAETLENLVLMLEMEGFKLGIENRNAAALRAIEVLTRAVPGTQ